MQQFGLADTELSADELLERDEDLSAVDHHVAAILRKLEVHTRTEASAKAVRLGLAVQR